MKCLALLAALAVVAAQDYNNGVFQFSTLKGLSPLQSRQQVYQRVLQTPVYSQVVQQRPVYTQVVQSSPVYSQYSPVIAQYSRYTQAGSPTARILSQVQEADPLGPYRASYATENGISATEQGDLVGAGPEGPAVAKQGSYSYTGPDGVQYTVNWVADENGFRAAGAHLPTPPPVPAEIQRSLQIIAANPQQVFQSFEKK